jgi:WXG100 protein secretion system (Wss), protein YukD
VSTQAAKKITVKVVVSSVPVEVEIEHDARVEHLIEKALKEADQKHPDLVDWKLRSEGGEEYAPDQKLAAAGIVDGVTLFLNKDAGGGG